MSSDNDIISWPVNTQGSLILCYRDTRIYLGQLHRWLSNAELTAISTFADTTGVLEPVTFMPTRSYHVYWRDLLAQPNLLERLPDHERVVRALETEFIRIGADEVSGHSLPFHLYDYSLIGYV